MLSQTHVRTSNILSDKNLILKRILLNNLKKIEFKDHLKHLIEFLHCSMCECRFKLHLSRFYEALQMLSIKQLIQFHVQSQVNVHKIKFHANARTKR